MIEFIQENLFFVAISLLIIMLFVLYIDSSIKLAKLRKNYKDFMSRLGKGENILDYLNNYMNRVEKIERDNKEIANFCKQLELEKEKCFQKMGIVRYNAFDDVGSDLSFSLAILDKNDNGYILNAIYARDSSNIYAKPIEDGKSKYVLSKEEQEALQKAIEMKK